jgi:hypothetical protein
MDQVCCASVNQPVKKLSKCTFQASALLSQKLSYSKLSVICGTRKKKMAGTGMIR